MRTISFDLSAIMRFSAIYEQNSSIASYVYTLNFVFMLKAEHFNYDGAFSARRSPERVGHRTIRLLVLFSCTCRVYSARLDP